MKLSFFNNDGTVRGAYVNLSITFSYLILIIIGVFYKPVGDQIIKLESFMTWFFGISFTVWSAKKTIEFVVGSSSLKVTPNESSEKIT